MSGISAASVKALREKTGAGLMDCKKALSATGGDVDQAIQKLRKEGLLKAAKKAGRSTNEGIVGHFVDEAGKGGSLVEVSCETDFVARTDDFQNFVKSLARHVATHKPESSEALNKQSWINDAGQTVEEALKTLIAKLGENMEIRRFEVVTGEGSEKTGSYLHAGSRIAVLVKLKGEATADVLKDVAMHVAAMNPLFVRSSEVTSETLEKEKEVARAQLDTSKPAEVQEKILQGKLRRYFSENCLVDQPFVKDTTGKKTVGQHLKDIDPGLDVVSFVRFQVGEEV